VCTRLLEALEASDGRRRRRKRDQTPDTLGLAIKRSLLESAVADDPDPEAFEGWLLERALAAAPEFSVGAVRAMALDVFTEWRLACESPDFDAWLAAGAPSDDRAADDGQGATIDPGRTEPPIPSPLGRHGPFRCAVCGAQFTTREQLDEHRRFEHREP
jgi:hypothetical protein